MRELLADAAYADAAKTLLFEGLDTSFAETLLFEALWQQLYQGEGPFCFCAPYISENCSYRSMLAKVWQQTKPDPEGTMNWKTGDPPECIRDNIKALAAGAKRTPDMGTLKTTVSFLLLSRKLDEDERQTADGIRLRTYQVFKTGNIREEMIDLDPVGNGALIFPKGVRGKT